MRLIKARMTPLGMILIQLVSFKGNDKLKISDNFIRGKQ